MGSWLYGWFKSLQTSHSSVCSYIGSSMLCITQSKKKRQCSVQLRLKQKRSHMSRAVTGGQRSEEGKSTVRTYKESGKEQKNLEIHKTRLTEALCSHRDLWCLWIFIKQQHQSRSQFSCNFMHFSLSHAFEAKECKDSAVDCARMLSASFREKHYLISARQLHQENWSSPHQRFFFFIRGVKLFRQVLNALNGLNFLETWS